MTDGFACDCRRKDTTYLILRAKDAGLGYRFSPIPQEQAGVKLAIVDDEFDCAVVAQTTLSRAGYSVDVFQSVAAFKRAMWQETFDVVCLDWSMPEESGMEVLRWIRNSNLSEIPVIMISAKAESRDISEALDMGADDYVVKPYDGGILCSRINALIRRAYSERHPEAEIRAGAVKLDPASMRASVDEEPVELTAKEFQLAAALFKNLGRPLARDYLLETIWGTNRDVMTRTVETHVARIRQKLGLRPENGLALRTIYGFGYRLELVVPAHSN